jgi:hypothetical protein
MSLFKDPEVKRKCFESRDSYYQCHKTLGPEECQAQLQLYSESCPEKWRQYWNDKFKDDMKQYVLELDARASKLHGVEVRGSAASNPYN